MVVKHVHDNSYRRSPISVITSTETDAFGRLRVASPHSLLDSKQIFDNQPDYWDDQEVSGSGTSSTHSIAKAHTALAVSANTAGKRVRQTFQRFNYQPGKSLLMMFTANTSSLPGDGNTISIGYFDDNNGIINRIVDGQLFFAIRSSTSGSPVDDVIPQSEWNGDKLDGTGPSGIALNPLHVQIFWMDMEWLGTGTQRMGFVLDGKLIVAHSFHHANANTEVYMSTPNLPARFEIENDGTGAALAVNQICITVISEGGMDANGRLRYTSTEETFVSATSEGTIYALIGLKLQAAYTGQQIDFTGVSVINSSASDYEWMVLINPTVAGTFTYSDLTNTSLQRATGVVTNTVTGGILAAGGMAVSSTKGGGEAVDLDTAQRLGAAIDGTQDTIVLCARRLTANASFGGSVSWRELV